MDDQIKISLIARISQTPGYRELVELLEDISKHICTEAFNCTDDSRAQRLLYEGRGATQLLTRFKSEIERLKHEQENHLG